MRKQSKYLVKKQPARCHESMELSGFVTRQSLFKTFPFSECNCTVLTLFAIAKDEQKSS